MIERFNPIPQRLRPFVYGTLTLAGFAAAACGGSEAKAVSQPTILPPTSTVEVPPTPTTAPTIVPTVAPTPEPTPRIIKTILDKAPVNADIQSIKSKLDSFYNNHPEANFWSTSYLSDRVKKSTLDGNFIGCEKGDSIGADAQTIRVEREASCKNIIRITYDWYKTYGNEELLQIAQSTRDYFIKQYPERTQLFEQLLRTGGVN